MNAPELEVHLDADDLARSLRADVINGLTAEKKTLPPKWFYDARGSELFERITELPEYYPTRAERQILTDRATEIAAVTRATALLELGSGYSTKTRLLLDALTAAGTLRTFAPMDVSPTALTAAASRITADYPGLAVHNIVGDLTRHLKHLPTGGDRLVAFLGGTIGNLVPAERAAFLADVRAVLEPGEHLLLGTDLVKSPSVVVPAYDDAQGVTAEFNRNVLRVLNASLGADFDLDGFAHVALWDAEREWIEMRLRARWPMRATIPGVGLVVDFAAGEEVRTEVSAKFRREGVERELAEAGFALDRWWTDRDGLFAVSLARAVQED
ncbi:L-histidine N(alpha)-methyltransferase [Actinoplanes sp. CA-030573]|uniref:L-histidine N(alpha)-methyltransferase n=1 Tax=Actinoplanes sp. CA-030573 TaxID=3239898 RepID=UPI003D921C7F